jgi:hypothetical protein
LRERRNPRQDPIFCLYWLGMLTRQRLFAELGGRHRFYQLRTAYKKARPHKSLLGPRFLTADEVFLQRARENGFSDEQINMFIDHVVL